MNPSPFHSNHCRTKGFSLSNNWRRTHQPDHHQTTVKVLTKLHVLAKTGSKFMEKLLYETNVIVGIPVGATQSVLPSESVGSRPRADL